VRRYLLGLTLLAATQEMDLFLREGCLLRYASTDEDRWYALPRRGDPRQISFENSGEIIKAHMKAAAEHFKGKWPKDLDYEFNIDEAKKLLARKGEQEETPAAG